MTGFVATISVNDDITLDLPAHAKKRMEERGISRTDVTETYNNPDVTHDYKGNENKKRHIKQFDGYSIIIGFDIKGTRRILKTTIKCVN